MHLACLRHARVAMMQTADFGDSQHSSPPRRLDDARKRGVVVQSVVRPSMVVIIEVRGQDAFAVGFVEHDDMIEVLPPDRADQPFDVGILPGRTRAVNTSSTPIRFRLSRKHSP